MGKWWASRLFLFDAGGSGICGSGLLHSLIEKTTLCIHLKFKKKKKKKSKMHTFKP